MNELQSLNFGSIQALITKTEAMKKHFIRHVLADVGGSVLSMGLCNAPFEATFKSMYAISALNTGHWIQEVTRHVFNLDKRVSKNVGDATSKLGDRIEIKSSACYDGSSAFKINRIRPFEGVTHYLLVLYDGNREELMWVYVPAASLYQFMDDIGFTTATDGSVKFNANRPDLTREFNIETHARRNTQGSQMWDALQPFVFTPSELYAVLNDREYNHDTGHQRLATASLDSMWE